MIQQRIMGQQEAEVRGFRARLRHAPGEKPAVMVHNLAFSRSGH